MYCVGQQQCWPKSVSSRKTRAHTRLFYVFVSMAKKNQSYRSLIGINKWHSNYQYIEDRQNQSHKMERKQNETQLEHFLESERKKSRKEEKTATATMQEKTTFIVERLSHLFLCTLHAHSHGQRERAEETPTSTEFLHDQQPWVVSVYVSVVGVAGQLRSDMHLEMSKIICVNKIDLEMCAFLYTRIHAVHFRSILLFSTVFSPFPCSTYTLGCGSRIAFVIP